MNRLKKDEGVKKPYPRSYDEAKNRIKRSNLEEIQGHIKEIPEENRMDEIVLTLYNEDFLAKTYIPDTFFKKTRFENIGSRRWVFEKDSKMKYSKMHFERVDQEFITSLQQILDSTGNALTKSFKK
ncbi:hypothetical protein P7H06_24165 [Paenibacillus larvae]|nr:hypothetical protein [Paenibacillus larvae]MDT2261967.1 hypothetical protein [Paenibacillus larvae]